MARFKSNPNLLSAASGGARWLRTPGSPDLADALPYIPTSRMADAWLIGAWVAYWQGKSVTGIRKSRGHWYAVQIDGYREAMLRVADPYDHRAGVESNAAITA